MIKTYCLRLLPLLIILLTTCGQERQHSMLVPDATIYRTWKKMPALLNYPIPGHRDNFRIIYINPTGEKLQRNEQDNRIRCEYPEGTIIVKEVYVGADYPETQEQPTQLTVMIKAPQDPKARNGWLWISKDVSSGTENIIDYEFCSECHSNANEPHPYGDGNPDAEYRDYVYFPPNLPEQPHPVKEAPSYNEDSY